MTQKDSKTTKGVKGNVSSGSGQQLQIVFGRLHNLWEQNSKLWQKIAELERSNVELKKSLKGGF